MSEMDRVRVAAVQAAGVPFDREGATDVVCAKTAEAAAQGAQLRDQPL